MTLTERLTRTERLTKIIYREAFLAGWEHAQFMHTQLGHCEDTDMVRLLRAELVELKETKE